MSRRYELEFDIWTAHGNRMLPQRIKVVATTRAYAEKRMRDVVYKHGGYNGRYVAFYPNGTIKAGRVGKPPVEGIADMRINSAITSREFHHGFGIKNYIKR